MKRSTLKELQIDRHTPTRQFFEIVHQQILELQQLTQRHAEDMQNETSKWSLHQQLEHLNITGRSTPPRIEEALESNSSPEAAQNSSTLFKNFEIERHTEIAPEFSLPKGTKLSKLLRTYQRLEEQFLELKPKLEQIESHPGKREHPILGPLSAREWLMFMAIHQDHHLNIIHDIIEA
jgi:hypothetical protein